jgi:hypothetical protein
MLTPWFTAFHDIFFQHLRSNTHTHREITKQMYYAHVDETLSKPKDSGGGEGKSVLELWQQVGAAAGSCRRRWLGGR